MKLNDQMGSDRKRGDWGQIFNLDNLNHIIRRVVELVCFRGRPLIRELNGKKDMQSKRNIAIYCGSDVSGRL